MKLQLWLKSESERARLFWTGDPGKKPVPGQVWIPRSVCKSVLKYPNEGGPWRRCDVEVEDWWAAKNPLNPPQPARQKELGI